MLPTSVYLVYKLIATPVPKTGPVSVPIASHTMPMNDRYGNEFVNTVFKDNILLTLNYMSGTVTKNSHFTWSDIEKPMHYEFTLTPGQSFAFHDILLPEFTNRVVKTTNAHFGYDEGFKSDGYLTGDGVCHLASLIYWVAQDAKLETFAPKNHNFAVIPDIPKEYGVAVYDNPVTKSGANTNLYITNPKDVPVTFVFDYQNEVLTVSLTQESK